MEKELVARFCAISLVIVACVCAIVPVVQGQASPSKYNDELGRTFMWYSAAAYSEPIQVTDWKFPNPLCNNHTLGFTFAKAFLVKKEWSDAFAYVGYTADNIIVGFKGTNGTLDALHDFLQELDNWIHYDTLCVLNSYVSFPGNDGLCDYYHDLQSLGILNYTLSLQRQMQLPIIVTGHSLGGAAATLFTMDYVSTLQSGKDITLITYGEPRVGDIAVQQFLKKYQVVAYRVVHDRDIVAHAPPCCSWMIFERNCKNTTQCPYQHGAEVWYNSNSTSYTICEAGESMQCSDQLDIYTLDDHLYYFGYRVGQICDDGPVVPTKNRNIKDAKDIVVSYKY